jgi:hypothetical protein
LGADPVFHPSAGPAARRPGRRLAGLGMAGVLVVTGSALLAGSMRGAGQAKAIAGDTTETGTTLAAAPARAMAFCDPGRQDCAPSPPVRLAQLNSDITALFPSSNMNRRWYAWPLKPRMPSRSNPQQSVAPSDLCPFCAHFAALAAFVTGLGHKPAYSTNPGVVIWGDVAAIRSAPIWSLPVLAPDPSIRHQPPIGAGRHPPRPGPSGSGRRARLPGPSNSIS